MRRMLFDRMPLLVLLLLSAVLHFVGLTEPLATVMDEVYYGRYLNAYGFSQTHLFDIHPPHTKITLAFAAKILGFQGVIDFREIGQSLEGENVSAMRFLPALIGTWLPLLFYFLMRQLGALKKTAFLAAFALALDGAFLVQTRTLAQDGILVFWILVALNCVLVRTSRLETLRYLCAGLACAMAVGTKFTGLIAPFLVVVFTVATQTREKNFPRLFSQMLSFSVGFVWIYCLGWWVHFYLMTNPGSGDAFYRFTGNYWTDFFAIQRQMLKANIHITQIHPYSSRWYQWPLMQKPIFMWVSNFRMIYLIGNPVVWLGSLFMMAFGIVDLCFERSKRFPRLGFALLAYLISFVPFAFVSRPLFIYHYLPALMFCLAFGLLWWEETDFAKRIFVSKVKSAGLFATIALGLVFVSPFIYGIDLPRHLQFQIFQLFTGWR